MPQSKPIWGTCAGLIFIAKNVGTNQSTLALMDIEVERNAFGSQLDSFTQDLKADHLRDPDRLFPGVFIRAPNY